MKSLLVASFALSATLAWSGPVLDRPAAVVVETICAACHGANLTGGSAPNLLDDRWNHGGEDEAIRQSLREGWPATGMPSFREVLTPGEVQGLLELLRAHGRDYAAGRIQPPPPPPPEPIESELHRFRVETVADTLDTPWGLAFLPDGRLLVTERSGSLRVIADGKLDPRPIEGLPTVHHRQDGGLFDVVLHPDYARNGWIYLAYAEPGVTAETSMTVVVRGRIQSGRWTDQQVLFRAGAENYTRDNSHFGCRLLFDRTGHLLFTIGDRGVAADAQNLASPRGKIHRIRDDGTVPADNPFVGTPGALGTIWSYGHRHSQGLGFDPKSGRLWASEHGPIGGDELNRIEPGRNYGWPIAAGGADLGRTFVRQREGLTAPVLMWSPSLAPSGVLFYTGDRFPRWKNQLLVACLISQQVRRIETAGDRVVAQEILFKGQGRVRALATGPDGLIYLALNGTPGRVARLVPLDEGEASTTIQPVRSGVTRGVFGRTPDGVEVESYTLRNAKGAVAKVITYGAILADLQLPDRTGLRAGVIRETVASEKGFEQGFPQAAAVFGRVANRISQARFAVDGVEYRLRANEGVNHLHGGDRAFNRVLWRATVPDLNRASVELNYVSRDGEDGFPGTVAITVTYTLTDDSTLRLDYRATTDRTTPLNLTNHAYFNLGGGGDVLDHEVEIAAQRIAVTAENLIPTGAFAPVRDSVVDFTRLTRLAARAGQLLRKSRYDHSFVLDSTVMDRGLRFAARVVEAESGRQMEVWTTEPCLQLYTSPLSEQPVIARVGFFCLEAQHFPDSVNRPEFPSTLVRPGEVFLSTTEYRFSTVASPRE
ncbi:MAG: PQQ-dependent sugar dehydrogenase [Opitutaceae bacterium]